MPRSGWRFFCTGLVLLIFGLAKLFDRDFFLTAIQAHGILSGWSAGAVSYIVPMMEVLLGIATLWAVTASNRASAVAALAVSGMMIAMTVYAAALWISPPPVPVSCGCLLNSAPVESWMPVTLRNGTLAAAAALVARALIGAPTRTQQARPITA